MPSLNRAPDLTLEQDSGALWPVYNSREYENGFTIVTSAGSELVDQRMGEIEGLVQQYRLAEMSDIAPRAQDESSIRSELGRGHEAIVYSMGSFAVREQIGITSFYTAVGQLQRMDAISDVIDHGLPRWLRLPIHYALIVDPSRQKTYTVMEKVNSGITLEDIEKYPHIAPTRRKTVLKSFGNGIMDAKKSIPDLFDKAHLALTEALTDSGKDPSMYLTDWAPKNAIVQPLRTPIARSRYLLSVIDQYMA
jgi:hypothetical protein